MVSARIGGFRIRVVATLAILLGSILLVGQGCGSGASVAPPQEFTLSIWRTQQAESDFEEAIEAYTAAYPHVTIDYRTVKEEDYVDELLAAWSRGEGPDIFSIPNARMGEFVEFSTPAPDVVQLPKLVERRSFGRTITEVDVDTIRLLQPNQVRDRFVEAVYQDAVIDDELYGLPYTMDALTLYYNRDLLSRAQVAVPPTTWEEFRNAVEAITVLETDKTISQPAVALGTHSNVPYYFDILSVIMMQNGADMTQPNGSISFAFETEDGRLPGVEALDFYSKFADDRFVTFTWNDDQLDGIEAFTQGTTAFYFGYQRDMALIEQRAPGLNFSYTALPQIDKSNPVNYASYWLEGVHIGSEHADHAWNFIHFMAGDPDRAQAFYELTNSVPALRSLIGGIQDDPDLGVFAQEALTAQTWYRGNDIDAALLAFAEMIDGVATAEEGLSEVVELANRKVQLTVSDE